MSKLKCVNCEHEWEGSLIDFEECPACLSETITRVKESESDDHVNGH